MAIVPIIFFLLAAAFLFEHGRLLLQAPLLFIFFLPTPFLFLIFPTAFLFLLVFLSKPLFLRLVPVVIFPATPFLFLIFFSLPLIPIVVIQVIIRHLTGSPSILCGEMYSRIQYGGLVEVTRAVHSVSADAAAAVTGWIRDATKE